MEIDFLAIGISGLLGLVGIQVLFSGFDDDDDDDDEDDGSGEGSPVGLFPAFFASPA